MTCWGPLLSPEGAEAAGTATPAPGTAGAGIGTSRQASARWLFRLHQGSCGTGRELGGTCVSPTAPGISHWPQEPPPVRGWGTPLLWVCSPRGQSPNLHIHTVPCMLACCSRALHACHAACMLPCTLCTHSALTFVPSTHPTHTLAPAARTCLLLVCTSALHTHPACTSTQAHAGALRSHPACALCSHQCPSRTPLPRVPRLHHCTSGVLAVGPCTCILLVQALRSRRGPHRRAMGPTAAGTSRS